MRITAAVALLWGFGASAALAQAPYRQELIPGFSSLFVAKINPDFVDLDGDGDLDATVGERYGALLYFENIGTSSNPAFAEATGTASPFLGIDVGSASSPDLVDLDGDGDVDAIVGGTSETLKYFENTGASNAPAFVEVTGTANPFFSIDVGWRSNPNVVDLDGDGDPDAIVGDGYGRKLRYYENIGTTSNPAFAEATGTANPFYVYIGHFSNPALVDLDDDGDLDAVVGEEYGSLQYVKNIGTSGSPAFVKATGTANPFSNIDVGQQSSPELADLDGDGDLDVVVGEYGGHLVFYRSYASFFVDQPEREETFALSKTNTTP